MRWNSYARWGSLPLRVAGRRSIAGPNPTPAARTGSKPVLAAGRRATPRGPDDACRPSAGAGNLIPGTGADDMPRRKKTFPCGHRGFGSVCHACEDATRARERAETERQRAAEARREEKAAKAAVLESSPIPLDGLPEVVQRKALEVMAAVTAGRPWQEFKGKKIESRRGLRVVVPLGWSYRLLFRWNGGSGLVPEEALSHETYNGLFS